jgi:hypothetical protein
MLFLKPTSCCAWSRTARRSMMYDYENGAVDRAAEKIRCWVPD